jgi:hypothetical protein
MVLITISQGPALPNKFNSEWRAEAIRIVEEHLVKHPKCDLKDIVPTLREMKIYSDPSMPAKFRAVMLHSESGPMIFINPNLEWDRDLAVLTFIHEALHATKRNGRWICGPDREDRNLTIHPSCILFGKIQFRSSDIDRDLREHLKLD